MRKRDHLDLDDDIVADGESVRRPMLMMDHRPGYARLTDAQVRARREARDAYVQKLQTAWRTDARRKRDDDDEDDDDELDNNDRSISDACAMAMRKAAYISWRARLSDAWRMTPTRDGPGSAAAEELLRCHLGGDEPARDHENPRIPDPTDPGDPNENLIRRHLTTESTAAAQRERDRIWEDYRQRLSTAWQTGQTNPRAATAIERQGEQWRHGR